MIRTRLRRIFVKAICLLLSFVSIFSPAFSQYAAPPRPAAHPLVSSPALSELRRFVNVRPGPAGERRPVVYLLQDVHANEEAQRNLAGALGVLLKAHRAGTPFTVGLEGTSGPLDFAPF